MTDFPYVSPPADGLYLAMATARGRRVRKAGASTSFTATAIVVLALLAGSTGRQTLLQQPAPETPAVTGEHKVPSGRVAPSTANAIKPGALGLFSPTLAGTGTPGSAQSGQAGAQNSGSSSGASGLDPSRSQGSAAKPYRAGPLTRNDNQFSIPACAVNGETNSATLCPNSNASAVNNTPSVYQFYADICSAQTDTTSLHYPSSNEVDFAVYNGDKEIWRWSSWHPATDRPHQITLQTGTCSSWTFNWTSVDGLGNKVPRGAYKLKTTFLAAELSSHRTHVSSFTVS